MDVAHTYLSNIKKICDTYRAKIEACIHLQKSQK